VPRIEFTVESPLPPERIIAAAADFSDRRPEIWPNISRRYYEVHERGDTWAEATEGSDVMGGIWARERYDWSTPGVVRATVLDSNIFAGGTWELHAASNGAGGSRITVINDRRPKGKGKVSAVLMTVIGKRLLSAHLRKTLAILEREPDTASRPAAG
jgi:polyketide cyclase/dehydrase/lipid transport protein